MSPTERSGQALLLSVIADADQQSRGTTPISGQQHRRFDLARWACLVAVSGPRASILVVPRISSFYGIDIEMYFGDHAPPHFHARYGGDEALIVIATGDIYAGALPTRALRLVREWLHEHREELERNFDRGVALEPLENIDPLP